MKGTKYKKLEDIEEVFNISDLSEFKYHLNNNNEIKFWINNDFNSFLILAIIKNTKIKLINYIIKRYTCSEEYIIQFLNIKKNKIHLSKSQLQNIINKENIKINGTDCFGSTPLHYACHANKDDIVKILVGTGADINAKKKEWYYSFTSSLY